MLALDHMMKPVGLDDPLEIGGARHDAVRQAAMDDPVVEHEIDRAIAAMPAPAAVAPLPQPPRTPRSISTIDGTAKITA